MPTETLFDPLRRKEVAATPEERVRQWFIALLMQHSSVPPHLMMSEAPLQFGAKKWRADILVYDRNGAPLAVVECKRPGVDIDKNVAGQAMRYNMVLNVHWIILTNGERTLVFKREGTQFKACGTIPVYEEMLCRQ